VFVGLLAFFPCDPALRRDAARLSKEPAETPLPTAASPPAGTAAFVIGRLPSSPLCCSTTSNFGADHPVAAVPVMTVMAV
jgi:hypothetical protein